MNVPAIPPGPDLDTLYGLFPDASDRPEAEIISGQEMPEPYRKLLVHTHHMTVTVESFYDLPVDVRVLQTHRDGDFYGRKILLQLQGSERVVQFGIVRIDLSCCSPPVRDEILAQRTPLGRVLIRHNVLRRIQPTDYLRVKTSPQMSAWFGLSEPATTYGRLGVIFCDHRPAIEVLEILAPIS